MRKLFVKLSPITFSSLHFPAKILEVSYCHKRLSHPEKASLKQQLPNTCHSKYICTILSFVIIQYEIDESLLFLMLCGYHYGITLINSDSEANIMQKRTAFNKSIIACMYRMCPTV